jgi:tRNA-binding EMAP/Myf-like protein
MHEIKNNLREADGTLSSDALAVLIVDALVYADIIKKEEFENAVKIASVEIDVRKEAGDY